MIRHILKKDWILLWPLVVLVAAIQAALELVNFKAGLFGSGGAAGELNHLLSTAWYVGLVAVAIAAVHEDPIPGAEQDWLIRPLPRTDLLLAKLLFVGISLCGPMLVLNVAHALAMGFPGDKALLDSLYKEAYVFVCLLVPAMALASITRNMTEIVILAAGLVVIYAISLWFSALLWGADRCPTCDTGLEWLQHVLQHLGLLVGSAIIFALQYYRRRLGLARVVAAIGVVVLVFAQLPWSLAFAIQSRLSASQDPLPRVALRIDPEGLVSASGTGKGPGRSAAARKATQALLHGNLTAAVGSLKGLRDAQEPPVHLRLPLQLTGVSDSEVLLRDAVELSLSDADGRLLYHSARASDSSAALTVDPADTGGGSRPAGPIYQQIDIPGQLYRQVREHRLQVTLTYSLTLMRQGAEYKVQALGGSFRNDELGICGASPDTNSVVLRCRQLGGGPFCFKATLYGPERQHNPEVLQCIPDYRPYIPPPPFIIGYGGGVVLPDRDPYGLAHYAVDDSMLPEAYVILKVYSVYSHFRRTVLSPLRLADVATSP